MVGAVAVLAGADAGRAALLGLSMTALQASIGAVNDLHDAPADAGHKPGKPIPAGLVSVRAGRLVAVLAAVAGAGTALAVGGPNLLVLAGVVLGIGLAYDLLAKGTPWSWLPFAVGIPLLPVYGWLGASGSVPDWFAVLIPAAALAGMALAIANARADHERDQAAGVASISTWLGLGPAWRVHLVAWAAVAVLAMGSLLTLGASWFWITVVGVTAGTVAAAAISGRGGDPVRRERAWQGESVAAAAGLVLWLAAVLTS